MSEQNSSSSEFAGVFVFITTGVLFIGMVFAAFLAFLAFALTIAAIFAWNKPRRIGSVTIMPEDARAFVHRGLLGAMLVPGFLVFFDAMFAIGVNWSYLPQIVFGGYVIGSVGVEMMFTDDNPTPAPPASPPEIPAEPAVLPPPQKPKPFQFASWDDDEELS